MLLAGGRVVQEHAVVDGWLRVEGSLVAEVGSGVPKPAPGEEVIDCHAKTIVPGFVDLHVHGGGGADFLAGDASAVAVVRAFHRERGTTRSLASLVAAPVDSLCEALQRLGSSVESGLVAGVHLEGPFLSATRPGALDSRYLIPPDAGVLRRLLDAGQGIVRMVTIAPELPGAIELIPIIRDAGAIAALGHTDASFEVTNAAIDAGASVATHLWNAMRPVQQRDPGVVVAALLRSEITAELIADGVHLHRATVRLSARTLGERMVFVSDATAAAGLPSGAARLGSTDVEVTDGVARVPATGAIAGSTTTLGAIVRYSVAEAGIPLLDAVLAAATRPARLAGLDDGVLKSGRRADLVVFDENLAIDSVMADGRFVPPIAA